MKKGSHLLAMVWVLAQASLHAEEQLTTLEDEALAGDLQAIAEDGTVSFQHRGEAAAAAIPCRSLMRLDFGTPVVDPAPEALRFTLRNGDVIIGTIQESDDDGTLVQSPGLGVVRLPALELAQVLAEVVVLRNERPLPPPPTKDDDVLTALLANGGVDSDTGLVERLGPTRVHFESDVFADRYQKPYDEIVRVVFAKSPFELKAVAGVSAVIMTREGSRLSGGLTRLAGDLVFFESPLLGALTMSRRELCTVRFVHDRLVFLSDLTPAEVHEYGPIRLPDQEQTLFPFRRDEDFSGGVPSIRKKRFAKTLVAHVHSAITFTVVPDAQAFYATVGVSDEVLALAPGVGARVVFRVLVDGQVRFTSPVQSETSEPLAVKVALDKARTITLELTWAEEGSPLAYYVKGRGVWGNARFIKP